MIMIENATIDNIKRLLEIEKYSFGEDSYPLSKRAFLYHIKKGDRVFVAKNGEKISGYVLIFRYSKSFRIYSIATSKECRGKGVAKKLINFCMDRAKKEGKETISLEVAESNKKARELYESFGFREYRAIPSYYPQGDTGYKMRAKL
ncbi:MAG: GNAT family N-acetyltransferase [Campylobacterales bacterium]